MRATERNRELASLERFTEEPNRFGAYRVALGFPNSYEIGMSNLGFQWVYRLFNRVPDLVCERFFFEEGTPAVSFETGTPLSEFGLLAWSLSWEMDIVNIVKTLRAAGIPARRAERGEGHPLILIGGDIARMNPAALTTFADVFALGDGERLVPAIAQLLQSGLTREEFLSAAAKLPGFFVPAVHGLRAEAAENSRVVIQQPMSRKEIAPHFEVPHSTILTPRTELADKLLIEISRGCTEMCRFCWAAYAMAPIKQYPAASILKVARQARPLTDRTGLIATAVCDHPEITEILTGLADLQFHIALSSIKIDAIEDPILEVLARQGEKALAIAPEAGNERLRRHINKKVSDEMLREKVRMVFAHGFTRLKLYLQVGLPTETDEDVRDIVRLVADLREIALAEGRRTGQVPQLVPSVNAFIPKPHTPYEDESLAPEDSLKEKLSYLQREFEPMGNVVLRGMSLTEAVWEAYLAKMDESGADILEEAASGVPVRRLLKTHRDRIAAVVRPASATLHASTAAPWSFRRLPLGGKGVRDAGDGRRDVGRVNGREDQVSRLRGAQGDAHGLRVPHLSDDEDVRSLTHGGSQGGREVRSVRSDLDLFDETGAVRMLVLDRVLDRDDVAGVAAVDLLDERRERRGLAGAGGAADQDETARKLRQRLDAGRKAQGGQSRRLGRERTHRGRRTPPLAVEVDAKASPAAQLVGRVGVFFLRVSRPRASRERRQDRLLDLLAGDGRLRQGDDGAVDPDAGGRTGHEKEIAAAPLEQRLEPPVESRGILSRGLLAPLRVQLPDQPVDVLDFVHKRHTTELEARLSGPGGRRSTRFSSVLVPLNGAHGAVGAALAAARPSSTSQRVETAALSLRNHPFSDPGRRGFHVVTGGMSVSTRWHIEQRREGARPSPTARGHVGPRARGHGTRLGF